MAIRRLPGAEDLPLPEYATPGSAGLDLPAAVVDRLDIAPGARARVPTGFALSLPQGFEGQIRPRSGLAWRHGIVLPNAPGTIDADYRGEIQVLLWNTGEGSFSIERGDRIAQLVIAPVARVDLVPTAQLEDTERGSGGFGHTGGAGPGAGRRGRDGH